MSIYANNGTTLDDSGPIIKAPVSIYDVKTVLQHPGHNDLATLCTESNINPTARYKPFKGGGLGVETNLYRGATETGWADGNEFTITKDGNNVPIATLSPRASANFGTNVPNLTFDADGFPNPGSAWTFDPPTGGVNSPYRLTDFNGYIHTRSNCWDYEIVSAPHFALRHNSTIVNVQTDARRKFQLTIYPFKNTGDGNRNKYYLSLADIALTHLSNLAQLYLWVAIIAEPSSTISGNKRIYAKRLPSSLGELFENNSFPVQVIEFDIVKDFPPIVSGSGQNVSFDTSSNNFGLYDIKGPFKLQFFIGPKLNEFYYSDDTSNKFGIFSNIYDGTAAGGIEGSVSNADYIKNIYGSTALQNANINTLSLAGADAGSDISTISYAVVNWNTQLTQIWCNSSKSQITFSSTSIIITSTSTPIKGTGTYNSSSNKTIFDITSNLHVLFRRGNVSGDYVDTIQTTVYFKISVSYLVDSSYTFTLGSETTTHRSTEGNPYTETVSYNSSIPLNGTSADNNPPHNTTVKDITVNGRVSSVSFVIKVERSGSSNGTYAKVLEQMFTCLV